MKPRNLLIAAAILAVLSGVVWWSQKHPPSANKGAAVASSPKLIDVAEKDVQSVDLKKKDGTVVDLQKQNGKWAITAPDHWAADTDAATGLISALNPVTADSVVDEKPTDVAKYGLNTPSLTVTVNRSNGKSDNLLFGDDVPAGSMVYARVNSDPKVYAVASSVKTSLDKTAKDLRDKRLLTFDTNKVTRVELASAKSDIEFGKNNANEWQILKPQPYRADNFQVEELLRKLNEAKMDLSGSADDAKKAAAAYASGSPVSDVKVSDAGGTETLDLKKNKDDYYAKSSVVPGVFKVSADLGKAVDKSLDEFRNKKLFDFGFSDPTQLSILNGKDDKTLARSGTDWKMNGKTMDPGSVQSVIDKLRDLAAAKFAAGGFTSPVLSVSVTSNDGKRVEKVEFARVGENYIARRENESALYQLAGKSVNDILEASRVIKPAASSTKK
jgi:hypothetical protein